jgi:hypothetical protein
MRLASYNVENLFERTRFCGQLPEPQDDGGDGNDGEVVLCGLFVSCGDTPELLEPGEAAFDQLPQSIKVLIQRILLGTRRVVRDHGNCALPGGGSAKAVTIVGSIGNDEFSRLVFEQRLCLWGIATLAGGQPEGNGAAQASNGHMDLGA